MTIKATPVYPCQQTSSPISTDRAESSTTTGPIPQPESAIIVQLARISRNLDTQLSINHHHTHGTITLSTMTTPSPASYQGKPSVRERARTLLDRVISPDVRRAAYTSIRTFAHDQPLLAVRLSKTPLPTLHHISSQYHITVQLTYS